MMGNEVNGMGRLKVVKNSAQDGGIGIRLKDLKIDLDGSALNPEKVWGILAGTLVHLKTVKGYEGDPWHSDKLMGEAAKELYLRAYREGAQAALNEAVNQGLIR